MNGGSVLRLVCLVDGVAAPPTSSPASSSSPAPPPPPLSPATAATSAPTSGDTEFVFWFRNGKLLNYDQDLRQRVSLSLPTSNAGSATSAPGTASPVRHTPEGRVADQARRWNKHSNSNYNNRLIDAERPQRRLESRLEISSVRADDSGNYSCRPSNSAPDVIQVFVIVSEYIEKGRLRLCDCTLYRLRMFALPR